jgi:hypothetical protein
VSPWGKPPSVGRLVDENRMFGELTGQTGTSKIGVRLGVGIITLVASGETNIPTLVVESSVGKSNFLGKASSGILSSWHSCRRDGEFWQSSLDMGLLSPTVGLSLSRSLFSSL